MNTIPLCKHLYTDDIYLISKIYEIVLIFLVLGCKQQMSFNVDGQYEWHTECQPGKLWFTNALLLAWLLQLHKWYNALSGAQL